MYKKVRDPRSSQDREDVILRAADNALIPFDPANADYQQYEIWIAEGNEPLPADE